MSVIFTRRQRKIFFTLNLAVQAFFCTASFLLTLVVLSQFNYANRVFKLEIGVTVSAAAEFVRYLVVSFLKSGKVNFRFLKYESRERKINFSVKASVYLLKLVCAIIVACLARYGGFEKTEEVALSTSPAAIAYMTFVFFAIFLNMFSVYVAVAFSDYSAPIKGRKVRYIGGEEAIGKINGLSAYDKDVSAVFVGDGLKDGYCEGVLVALMLNDLDEEIWVVVKERYALSKKRIKKELDGYLGEYKLITNGVLIELHCFVNSRI